MYVLCTFCKSINIYILIIQILRS